MEGSTHANREAVAPMMLSSGDPGRTGGNPGTYTGTGDQPTLEQYEAIFGPAGRDIKIDSQRHKRHQRWHLPDALKGPNNYLTDRVDGLITDATNSPFTRNILPYKYLENPDQKLKWNVYSFDEGIASRVPYEAAARVLPQSKQSFSGYVVRQGLAIAMEHNFMMSAAGRENFKNQLTQLVGSIQMTNDLDVHVALLQAPSYQRHIEEKYYDQQRTTAQACRQYTDLFGIMQKHPNALDILIEDAKNHLKTWGSQPPTFLLCNGKLTTQLTMTPERTNYLTNGPDGQQRLAQGPDLPSYRGLSIIHSRKFSLDTGTAPRDLMRRKVRVAEYYRIPWSPGVETKYFEFYDQSRDTMFRLSWWQLAKMAQLPNDIAWDEQDYQRGGPSIAQLNAQIQNLRRQAANAPLPNVMGLKHAMLQMQTHAPMTVGSAVYRQNPLLANNAYDGFNGLITAPDANAANGARFQRIVDNGTQAQFVHDVKDALLFWDMLRGDGRLLTELRGVRQSEMVRWIDQKIADGGLPDGTEGVFRAFKQFALTNGRVEFDNYKKFIHVLPGFIGEFFVQAVLRLRARWEQADAIVNAQPADPQAGPVPVAQLEQDIFNTATTLWNHGWGNDGAAFANLAENPVSIQLAAQQDNSREAVFNQLNNLHANAMMRSLREATTLNVQPVNNDPNQVQDVGPDVTREIAMARLLSVFMNVNPDNLETFDREIGSSKMSTMTGDARYADGVAPAAGAQAVRNEDVTRQIQQMRDAVMEAVAAATRAARDAADQSRIAREGIRMSVKHQFASHRNKVSALLEAQKLEEEVARKLGQRGGTGVPMNPEYFGDDHQTTVNPNGPDFDSSLSNKEKVDLLILRPNIEHEMLSIIMGRGGTQELGCTFWGQTELSCYDDAQHGIWGMSYKYHERAMVLNERNLIRVYDVAYDGYNGGLDQRHVDFTEQKDIDDFKNATFDRTRPYNAPSMLVMALPWDASTSHKTLPNPMVFWPTNSVAPAPPDASQAVSDMNEHDVFCFSKETQRNNVSSNNTSKYMTPEQRARYWAYIEQMGMNEWTNTGDELKTPGERAISGESSSQLLAFEGTMKTYSGSHALENHQMGSGHLGPSYVGVASIREGRGVLNPAAAPSLGRLI